MTLYDTMQRLGGVATIAELRSRGHLRASILRALGAETLRKTGRGRIASPQAPIELVRALQVDGVVSCISALRLLGLPTPADGGVTHCSIPPNRGTSKHVTGVRRHFETLVRVDARRIMRAPEAYARAASCLPYFEAVALLDVAETTRAAPTVWEILAIVRTRDRSLADDLAMDVGTGVRSFAETPPRLILRAAGIPTANAVVMSGVGEVDLLVAGHVVIEIDGYAFHSERKSFTGDRRRDRRLRRLGYTVLRYAWEDAEPVAVLRDVLDVLETIDVSKPPRSASRIDESARQEVIRLWKQAQVGGEQLQVSRRTRRALAASVAAATT